MIAAGAAHRVWDICDAGKQSGQAAMSTAKRIFISEEHGTYSSAEFHCLTDDEKLELIEAWFLERYSFHQYGPGVDTSDRTGPFAQRGINYPETLYTEFADLISRPTIGPVVTKLLMIGGFQWSYKPKSRDRGEDIEATHEAPLQLGTYDERHFRALVLSRLARLAELLDQLPEGRGMMGHNQPPGDISDVERAELDALRATAAELRAELTKTLPSVATIIPQCDTAIGINERLKNVIARKLDIATDELAKELGKLVGKLAFWGPLLAALAGAVAWLQGWLEALKAL